MRFLQRHLPFACRWSFEGPCWVDALTFQSYGDVTLGNRLGFAKGEIIMAPIDLFEARDRVSLLFQPDAEPNLQAVLDAVKQIVSARGCPSCGLNGFDLNLGRDMVTNPAISRLDFGPDVARLEIASLGRPSFVHDFNAHR